MIDAKQNVTLAAFDGASRSLGTTQQFYDNGDGSNAMSANSITTTRTLDGNGLMTQLKDGNGNVTGFEFDTLDRPTVTTFPDSSTRETEYNEASDVTVFTDELGTTFTNALDAIGRVTGVTLGGTSTPGTTSQGFQFDGLSRPTQAVDVGDLTITINLFHDSISRTVEEEHIFGGNTRHVTNTEFTSLPPTAVTYAEPENRVIDSFYDLLYRRNVVSDVGGKPIADWRFYGPSRIADFALGNGIMGSHLNDAGTNSAVQSGVPNPAWGDACSDRLGYDGTGRMIGKRYTVHCGSSSSSSSHSSSRSSSSSSPNSFLYIRCGYSSSSSPMSSSSRSSSHSSHSSGSSSSGCGCTSPVVYCQLLAGFTTDFDKSSNKFFERHLHAECRSFLYPHSDPVGWANDSANRLLQFQRGIMHNDGMSVDTHLALQGVDDKRQYNLDATGNWVDTGFSGSMPALQSTHDCHGDTEDRTANNLNQIATIDGNPLNYDLAGSLLGYKGLTFTFDGFKRLIGADGIGPDGSMVDADYFYDAMGRRFRKAVNGTVTDFVPMGSQVVEERSDDTTLLRQYVWGQYIDELIQQRELENAPDGQDYADWYPLTDLLFRSVALTDNTVCQDAGADGGSSGSPFRPNFVEVYDTDVYGRTNIYSDPGPDGRWFSDDDTPTFYPLCPYIYTGKRYEPETGLYFFNARYYDPDLGRFISRDQILYQGGMNVYQYCGGMPGSATDPSGQQSATSGRGSSLVSPADQDALHHFLANRGSPGPSLSIAGLKYIQLTETGLIGIRRAAFQQMLEAINADKVYAFGSRAGVIRSWDRWIKPYGSDLDLILQNPRLGYAEREALQALYFRRTGIIATITNSTTVDAAGTERAVQDFKWWAEAEGNLEPRFVEVSPSGIAEMSRLAGNIRFAGKVLLPVGVVLSAADIATAENSRERTVEVGASWAGAWAGGEIGAWGFGGGPIFGAVTTLAGAVLGGAYGEKAAKAALASRSGSSPLLRGRYQDAFRPNARSGYYIIDDGGPGEWVWMNIDRRGHIWQRCY